MKALFKGLAITAVLLLAAGTSWADTFSVSVDTPVSYKFNESALNADKASGVIVGVSLPFLIGIGGESYKVTGTVPGTGNSLENKVTMVDVYFDAPVPVINLRLGAGVGKGEFDTPAGAGAFDTATMTQLFVNVGIPFAEVFDVHVGYHAISGKAKEKASGLDASVGAKMFTVGLKVGF
ncbi:MAG TPA: hypothetical protein VKB51_15845 [bacterium]|nr:hypothetical protein [bacterium]